MDTTINLSTDGRAWDANQFVSELTAILGVRGSGKSNTASALVEELLDKGVPIVVVDIEGGVPRSIYQQCPNGQNQ